MHYSDVLHPYYLYVHAIRSLLLEQASVPMQLKSCKSYCQAILLLATVPLPLHPASATHASPMKFVSLEPAPPAINLITLSEAIARHAVSDIRTLIL